MLLPFDQLFNVMVIWNSPTCEVTPVISNQRNSFDPRVGERKEVISCGVVVDVVEPNPTVVPAEERFVDLFRIQST